VKNTKIKLNQQNIYSLQDQARIALEQTADALLTQIQNAEIVPFDQGQLHSSAFLDVSQSSQGVVELIYATPYARRLYFHPEYNFQTYEHAWAGGLWFEPWRTGPYKDFAQKTFTRLLKRLIKNQSKGDNDK
jgi:hypothetical protein